MDEHVRKEIHRLKEELCKQKEALDEINRLVNEKIDRDFPIDLWELSERELDNEMGGRLPFLDDDIDIKPDVTAVTSHRRIIGKPVAFFKRLFLKTFSFYTDTLLEKQVRFNDQSVAFHLACFIRFRQNERRLKEIEERVKTIEEDGELMLEQLDKLKNDCHKPGTD
jgi:hypothetical protein